VSLRRLFLDAPPDTGAVRLAAGETHHAGKVLRLRPGDEVLGLDGAGSAWTLRLVAMERAGPLLEPTGEVRREPPPAPRVEVALALPKAGRAEDMVDRLTQLGVGAVLPTWFERTQGPDRELSPRRRERLERAAREACKQCGRLWLPELGDPGPLGQRLGGTCAVLDPGAGIRLVDWRAGAPGDVRLVIGPEGGLTDAEREAALAAGATPVSLPGPILRIETAAELACGLVRQLP